MHSEHFLTTDESHNSFQNSSKKLARKVHDPSVVPVDPPWRSAELKEHGHSRDYQGHYAQIERLADQRFILARRVHLLPRARVRLDPSQVRIPVLMLHTRKRTAGGATTGSTGYSGPEHPTLYAGSRTLDKLHLIDRRIRQRLMKMKVGKTTVTKVRVCTVPVRSSSMEWWVLDVLDVNTSDLLTPRCPQMVGCNNKDRLY